MTTTFIVLSYLPPYFGFEPIDKSSVGWLVILDRVTKIDILLLMRGYGSFLTGES